MTRINSTKPSQFAKFLRPIGAFSSLLVPLLLFAGVLVLPLPRWLYEASRYDYWLFGGATSILFYFTFRCPGRVGRTLSLSSVLILFALPLARLWNTGASDNFVTGGLIPLSDAAVYYYDARSILQGGTMGEWGGQRPLFTGLFTALLGVTQLNLQFVLAILAAISAIATFFTAREIQKSHGAVAAAFITIGVFLFFRPFIGQALTESLGLPLGLLSFAALWRGTRQREWLMTLCGIFLLTFALNARIGTVFVLPGLVLWGSYYFRKSKRLSWKFLASSSSLIVIATLFNLLLLKVIGLPSGSPPFSNFAFTLYGLVTHTFWAQPYIDHPEVLQLGGVERNEKVYALALEIIYRDPLALVTGLLKAWREFFIGNYSIFFWDAGSERSGINADIFLRFNAFLGLIVCFRQRKNPLFSFMLVYALGAFLTIPLLPIWDASMRPYAVTIIILYAYATIGFILILKNCIRPIVTGLCRILFQSVRSPQISASSIYRLFSKPLERPNSYRQFSSHALPVLSLLLCLFCIAAPITFKLIGSAPTLPNVTCPAAMEARFFQINPGTYINLTNNNSIEQTRLPYVKIHDFRKGLKTFSPWAKREKKALRKLPETSTVIGDPGAWLIADTATMPQSNGWFSACGRAKQYGSELRLFYIDTIQPFSLP
jgi:hypothetical protein